MLGRLVLQSFLRAKRKKAIAVASVTIGVGVASGLFGLVTHMGDLVAEDLRRYGANILIRPDSREIPIRFGGVTLSAGARRLDESDLPLVKKNFWKHNILTFAPYLYAAVRDPKTGREFVLTGTWFEREIEGATAGSAPTPTAVAPMSARQTASATASATREFTPSKSVIVTAAGVSPRSVISL